MTTGRFRALDVSCGVGAAYCAKLLAELDWDVVKYEPPGGDPLRTRVGRWGGGAGGTFAFVNQGKRGVSGLQANRLIALSKVADVVVGDFSGSGLAEAGLAQETADALIPRQAVVSVSAFGLSLPRASWASSDFVVQAASGLVYMTGEWNQPPLQLAPYQAALLGGVAGASAAVLAANLGRRTGTLQYVDTAMVEVLTSLAYAAVSQYVHRGEVPGREQRVKSALRMVPAKDRFVYCAPGAVATMRMDGIAKLLNEPRLAEDRFQTAEVRMQNWDEFVTLFVPPFRTRTAQEWFERAESMHMTFALVQTMDDLFACPQLSSRESLRSIPGPDGIDLHVPARPFRIDGTSSLPLRPAPPVPGCDTAEVMTDWLSSGTRCTLGLLSQAHICGTQGAAYGCRASPMPQPATAWRAPGAQRAPSGVRYRRSGLSDRSVRPPRPTRRPRSRCARRPTAG